MSPSSRAATLFPYTTLFRSREERPSEGGGEGRVGVVYPVVLDEAEPSPELSLSASVKRSEEHTSELQSPYEIVCRLLLEKKHRKTRRRRSASSRAGWR